MESALPAPGTPNDPRRLGQDLINDIRSRLKSLGNYCCPDYAESLSDFVERSLLYHFDIYSIYQLRQGDVPMFKYHRSANAIAALRSTSTTHLGVSMVFSASLIAASIICGVIRHPRMETFL